MRKSVSVGTVEREPMRKEGQGTDVERPDENTYL